MPDDVLSRLAERLLVEVADNENEFQITAMRVSSVTCGL
jgi:hypothetical protein